MISEQKYRILCHCNVVPSGLKMTSETLGMSYNLMSSSMSRMVTEGLLDLEDGLYSTTPSARIEMRLYREAMARTVPAPKIDKSAATMSLRIAINAMVASDTYRPGGFHADCYRHTGDSQHSCRPTDG